MVMSELHHKEAHSTSTTLNQNAFSRLDRSPVEQPLPSGQRAYWNCSRLGVR